MATKKHALYANLRVGRRGIKVPDTCFRYWSDRFSTMLGEFVSVKTDIFGRIYPKPVIEIFSPLTPEAHSRFLCHAKRIDIALEEQLPDMDLFREANEFCTRHQISRMEISSKAGMFVIIPGKRPEYNYD